MRIYGVGHDPEDVQMFMTTVIDEAVALAQLTSKRVFALDVVGDSPQCVGGRKGMIKDFRINLCQTDLEVAVTEYIHRATKYSVQKIEIQVLDYQNDTFGAIVHVNDEDLPSEDS